jgi:hypothetical protein
VDPVDLGDLEHDDVLRLTHAEPLQVVSAAAGQIDRRRRRSCGPAAPLRLDPFHRRVEADLIDRFEQVVECASTEGPQGVLFVGGDEDDHRQRAGLHLPQQLEGIQAGHLNVQEQEVGAERPDRDQGFGAVAAFAGDFDLGMGGQCLPQAETGQNLVVHQQGAYAGQRHVGAGACR